MPGATFITGNNITLAIAVLTFAILAFTTGRSVRRDEKKDAIHKAELEKIAADKDKTALEKVAELAQESVTILKGGKPTWDNPNPKGLVDVVVALNKTVDAQGTLLVEHGKMIKSLQPNGGDTDNTGDLVYRIGKEMGLTNEDPTHPPLPE